jgi:hypothetical protein
MRSNNDGIRVLYVTQTGRMLEAFALAFDNPTRQALIPDMLSRRDLLNALSLNSATYTALRCWSR